LGDIKELRKTGKGLLEIKNILGNGLNMDQDYSSIDIEMLSKRIAEVFKIEINNFINKKVI